LQQEIIFPDIEYNEDDLLYYIGKITPAEECHQGGTYGTGVHADRQ
jgi:hypothetical protein